MAAFRFRQRRGRRFWVMGTTLAAAAAFAVVFVAGSSANLAGSTFEGNDGNLVVNTTGNTDWANAPNRVVGLDQASGSNDNSFGQGTKEDDPAATVVTGSIPPNKNDLSRFYVGSESAGGSNFLYLAWERLVNIGSANLDLEINQKVTAGFTGTTTGPVTLNRTAGDLLVTYDFGGSGTPTLGLLRWVTSGATSQCFSSNSLPCWGNRVNLTAAGDAEGAVNAATVTDPVPPNAPRTLTTGLFGEAAINLTAAGVFPAGTCTAFGSTFLKSRASTSFTAEVKDFSFTSTIPNPPAGSPPPTTPDCSADTTPSSFTLNDNGNTSSDSTANTEHCGNVPAGSYTVTEGSQPANFALESLTCTADNGGSGSQDATNPAQANITVVPNSTVTCVYVDKQQLGAIKITKTSTKGNAPLAGATFTITSGGTPISGSPFTTGSDGTVCVDHLPFGTYSVQETAAPTGYAINDTTAHDVNVTANSTCGDGNEATFTATDTPLSKITVSFQSLAGPGVTTATVQCTGDPAVEPLPEGTPKVLNNLPPGTYGCTVVVDP